jgi:hypothetical protein
VFTGMALLQTSYFSPTLVKNVGMNLIVPESIDGPYHVLFLLHGLSDDHSKWMRMTSVERYADGYPMIVVMPDGGRGFYQDGAASAKYGTALGKELPQLIKRWFPVHPRFAISGLSMGGYGSLRLGFEYSETFRSVWAFSGSSEFGMEGDYDRMESFPREFHNIVEVPAAGSRADLFKIAENATNPPAIGFDCGTEDWLIDSNRKFHAHLEKLGIPHEYREHPGGHDWTYWDAHIREAFEFHAKNLGFTGPNG